MFGSQSVDSGAGFGVVVSLCLLVLPLVDAGGGSRLVVSPAVAVVPLASRRMTCRRNLLKLFQLSVLLFLLIEIQHVIMFLPTRLFYPITFDSLESAAPHNIC